MNIHEHQAKQILKKYGAAVPEGVFSHSVEELLQKAKSLKTEKFVLKAQIHAGGRGKAGGIKIVNTIEELNSAAKENGYEPCRNPAKTLDRPRSRG